ncbi:carbohydrate ABC transporter permease [Bacillus sp. IB182487]|uniref:Carbohydrate ABC transporter permease n=1 Tax=Metabacillus arenae TaxID=2771434 RepID=A0A926NTD9_9BACI|nr:carbohydrate ABC transporter permease [Metabacillus arenae]
MWTSKYSWKFLLIEIALILLAIVYLSPFFFVVVNSFKDFSAILNNPASLPERLDFTNFIRAWEMINLPSALFNTILITIFTNLVLVIFASMAAYRLVRHPSKGNNMLFLIFVSTMVIPFQAIMIPLVQMSKWFSLINTIHGIVIINMGLIVPFTIFLYHGFIKTIPKEIEEAAIIDGCSPYGVFWRIVFPLLKPMTVTAVVLQSINLWNQFLEPLLFLQLPELHTIQIAINTLFGAYTNQWDLALAALTISILPIIVFFLIMQKQIVAGITSGGIKG